MLWRVRHGMVCAANVLIDTETCELEQAQIGRVYEKANVHYSFFDDVNIAKTWALGIVEQGEAV